MSVNSQRQNTNNSKNGISGLTKNMTVTPNFDLKNQ
jgi:hypothetical protein